MPPITTAIVHPLVLLSTVDHFYRIAKVINLFFFEDLLRSAAYTPDVFPSIVVLGLLRLYLTSFLFEFEL
jgi:hypothetical protein